MSSLQTKELTVAYGENTIIDSLDLSIPEGEVTVLVGGNGCGKSTLLRSMARLLKPQEGSIILDGESIAKLSTKQVAQNMAILPQSPVTPEGLTVLQLVKQGRYPYQSWFKQWSKADEEAVESALEATNMQEFRERSVDSLSGGQRQRAWIAMTLAQDTDTILLDEPTTYLDMTYQIEILDLLFELNETQGRTIIMVLHDLNLASRYAHHIVALKDQAIYAQGRPEHVVTCQFVRDVFHMNCNVTSDPIFGTPMCIPHGRGRCILQQTS